MLGDSVRRRRTAKRPRTPRAAGTARRFRWRFWLPVGLAALVLPFAIGYAIAVFLLFPAPEVQGVGVPVPDVVGMQLARASDVVRGAGLGIAQTVELPHPERAPGVVTAQAPLPGQQLRAGASVRLAISSGRPRVLVPDVVGFSQERAVDLLGRLGFEVASTEAESADARGRVIAVEPAPGTEHELPARVTVTVSTGPPELPVDTVQRAPLLRVDTLPGGVMQRIDTLPARPTILRTDTLERVTRNSRPPAVNTVMEDGRQ